MGPSLTQGPLQTQRPRGFSRVRFGAELIKTTEQFNSNPVIGHVLKHVHLLKHGGTDIQALFKSLCGGLGRCLRGQEYLLCKHEGMSLNLTTHVIKASYITS